MTAPLRGPMPSHGAPCGRRGLTLLEVVVSSLLVGVLILASLNAATSGLRAQLLLSERARAQLMAQDLIAEILIVPYEDVDSPAFGMEMGEIQVTRAGFDDVDDYHGWSSTPPTQRDGTPLKGVPTWRRTVDVELVDPVDLSPTGGTDLGGKRITVRVYRGDVELAMITTVVFLTSAA